MAISFPRSFKFLKTVKTMNFGKQLVLSQLNWFYKLG